MAEATKARRRRAEPIQLRGHKVIHLHFNEYSRGLPYVVKLDRATMRRNPHTHDFHEIAIITRGVGHHLTEYGSWPVQAGDVVVIGARHVHCYDHVRDLELVNVLFQRDPHIFKDEELRTLSGFHALFGAPQMRPRAGLERHCHLGSKELSHVLGIVAALEQELAEVRPGGLFLARAHFMLLIGTLARCYSRQPDADTKTVLRLAKAINHMEAHYQQDILLADIARVGGMSPRQLQRLFMSATGETPLAHLRNLRLMRAAEALRDQDNPVTEIAFTSGFNDSNYFSRQFRSFFGMSPRQYRREKRSLG
jgi:AraC family L-rhamnose operon transcriptional activator RhaR/AraC family L-rhamnose operon regulatory protein RhaS